MNFDLLRGILDDFGDYFSPIVYYVEDVYYKLFDAFSIQRLLPPFIMLIAVYLTLISLYRTTTLLIRTILFFVKWGGVIAIIAAAIGYFSRDSHSFISSKLQKNRASKPRIWNTFAEHQRWRDDESRSKEITDTVYEIVQEVADAAQQFARQGWRQALLRLAIPADDQNHRRTPPIKSSKGKAKSR